MRRPPSLSSLPSSFLSSHTSEPSARRFSQKLTLLSFRLRCSLELQGFSGGGDPYQELGGGSNRDSVGGMSNSPSQALSFTEGKEDDDWMYDEDPKARK